MKLKFPDGFLWGAATAAHQVEGNNVHSDWWAWEHSPKRERSLKEKGKDSKDFQSGAACDSYNRFEEDFALAKKLHQNAHRLSIEWARIEPEEGRFSEKELDHYEKVLQSAKFHGLTTFVTLHHFVNPLWFAKKGGFRRKENIRYFVKYCELAVKRLDQYVDFWMTFNEPESYAYVPHILGLWPPQKKNIFIAWNVARNLVAAHRQAVPRIRLVSQKPVSMAFHQVDFQPASAAARYITIPISRAINKYFIKRTIDTCDYIGLNYYFHHHVGLFGNRKYSHSHHIVSDMGWGIHPEGIKPILLDLKKYNKPVYITENGLADAKDHLREKFIKDHLYYAHQAIAEGVKVKGYMHWSLIDNFEWAEGFFPKFGLIEIDRENNLERKIRPSALTYAEICKNNYLEF